MRGLRIIETRRARDLRRMSTSAERILWQRLKNRSVAGFKFIRSRVFRSGGNRLIDKNTRQLDMLEHVLIEKWDPLFQDMRGANRPYIADFLCREIKLVIEIDGATHSTHEEIVADRRRTRLLEEQGFRILRVTVLESAEGVSELILERSKALS